MKQIIPFSKDIVFKTNIASITSISLEHVEKLDGGEISGEFIVFGDYKIHADTTASVSFKYRLPFTTLIPDSVIPSTITVDVENFTYDILENDVLHVNIDFSVEGEEQENIEEEYPRATEPTLTNTDEDYETDAEGNRVKQLDIFDEYQEQDEIDHELNNFLKSLQNLRHADEDETSTDSRLVDDDFNSTINNTMNNQEESDTFLYGTIAKDDIRKSPKVIDIQPSDQIVSEEQNITQDELNDNNRDNNLIQNITNQENTNIKINNYNDNDTSINNNIEELGNQENMIQNKEEISPIQEILKTNTSKNKESSSKENLEISNTSKQETVTKEVQTKDTTQNKEVQEVKTKTEYKTTKDSVTTNETTITEENENNQTNDQNRDEEENMTKTVKEEYVTYHIHIVKAEETLETIVKNYSSSLDTISLYNDVKNIKPGDKLLIPEYLDE